MSTDYSCYDGDEDFIFTAFDECPECGGPTRAFDRRDALKGPINMKCLLGRPIPCGAEWSIVANEAELFRVKNMMNKMDRLKILSKEVKSIQHEIVAFFDNKMRQC